MVAANHMPPPAGPVLARTEEMKRVAGLIQNEGAHFVIESLPGMGKSEFVRQLIRQESRESLGLGQDYLMVLLDGDRFAGLSVEHIRGAILDALKRAHSERSSQVCEARNDLAIERGQLRRALSGFSSYKLVLILDHCSSLCKGRAECICHDLLRRWPRATTFVTIPESLSADRKNGEEICRSSSVSQRLLPVPPEQAYQFLADALPPWTTNGDLERTLLGRIVDWVGGIPSLLRAVSDLLRQQLTHDTSPDRGVGAGAASLDLEFRRRLYDECRTMAKPFFDRWWKSFSKRDRMALLLVDELQRRGLRVPEAIGEASRKGAIGKIGDRYIVQPLLWREYLSERSKAVHAGPFFIDLSLPQVVHVNGRLCELSLEQANLFLHLLLQWDKEVYYDELYNTLRPTRWSVAEGAVATTAKFRRGTVDLVMDELRAALAVGPTVIERSPHDPATKLEGYRLAVEPEHVVPGQDRANLGTTPGQPI